MAFTDPALPEWFKSNGFDEYSDILTNELGVEEYDDFRLLRDENDVNELLDDMAALKSMNNTFKQKFKKEIMRIIYTPSPSQESKIKSKPTKSISSHSSKTKPVQKSIESKSKSKSKLVHKSRLQVSSKTDDEGRPKSAKIQKAASYESRPSHKKSRSSVTLGKKHKSKPKASSPPPSRSGITRPKSPKKDKSQKSGLKRSSTNTKLLPKKENLDTYDIDSISSKLSYNKSRGLKKSHSSKDFLSKQKRQKAVSGSLSLLDAKKRKQHKEEKNKTRGGFTVHTNRRVRLDDGRIGIVKYKGRVAFGKSSEDWIGIVVEHGKGQHNGTVNGRAYFRCRDGKGIMVRPDRIIQDLGNPNTKPLDDEMKKGDEEIQKLLRKVAKQRKEERMKKKRDAEAAAAAKERSNYGGDIGWKPAEFDDYAPDESTGLFKQKLMHSKTLLDKNKNIKAVKKKKVSEI